MYLPERYRGKAIPVTKQALWAISEVRKGNSLFLTGIPGSGKTHLAVALLNEWFAESMVLGEEGPYPSKGNPMFLPAVELLLEIKESWRAEENAQADSEKMILDKYSRKPLLIIDDLGAEKISEWSRQVVYLLIDRRYRDCKQTIITSNLSIQALANQLDARIASRISEMGSILEMENKDYRTVRK